LEREIMITAMRDPIAFELFKNSLLSIADEMALTIFRTAYSGVLKDVMDYSTALCDGEGQIVAQGLTLPAHLGSIPEAMASIMRHYGESMQPGDIYCLNDPFDGGMHLPDLFVIKPIFYRGERLAFAATVCHHTDMGGRVAGSNASDSTEVYAEGLRIPPLKMHDRGEPNKTLFAFIEKNVRLPTRVLGDIRAQLAACHIAEDAVVRLIERYGRDSVTMYMRELIDYAERLTRAAIRELPEGVYTFEDWIDDDGIDREKPIRLKVTLRKEEDRLIVDWTGSSPQVKGAINNTLSFTKAATYTCIKSMLSSDVLNNEGFFRAIEVIAPPGTIANAVLPAATAARGLTGFRMVDCCFGALALMLPDRVFAASEGGNTGITIGGYYADRTPFIYVDFLCSAWGGRPWADGLDGNTHLSPISLCSRPRCASWNSRSRSSRASSFKMSWARGNTVVARACAEITVS
jgi:N-methylhydantoinase B